MSTQTLEEHRFAVLRAQGFVATDTVALAAGQVSPAVQARIANAVRRRTNLAWIPLLGTMVSGAIAALMFAIDAPPIAYVTAGLMAPFGVLASVAMRASARNTEKQMRGELTVLEGVLRKGTDRINRRTRIYLEIDGWRFEDDGPVVHALHPMLVPGGHYRAYLAPGPFLLAIEPLPAANTLLRRHGPAFTSFTDE